MLYYYHHNGEIVPNYESEIYFILGINFDIECFALVKIFIFDLQMFYVSSKLHIEFVKKEI